MSAQQLSLFDRVEKSDVNEWRAQIPKCMALDAFSPEKWLSGLISYGAAMIFLHCRSSGRCQVRCHDSWEGRALPFVAGAVMDCAAAEKTLADNRYVRHSRFHGPDGDIAVVYILYRT